LPTAIFGTAALADERVSGWHALAEVLGWWTLCIGLSLLCTFVISRAYTTSRQHMSHIAAGIAVAVIFFALTIAEAQPGTPATIKDLASAPLEPLGFVGLAALAFLLLRSCRRSYRR
jgi:hypothetical protein